MVVGSVGDFMNYEIINYDKDSKEADIIIHNNVGNFICYAHPVENIQIQSLNNSYFLSFMTNNIYISEQVYQIKKNDSSYYSYKICGEYIGENIVKIGEIRMLIDSCIPKDIYPGEYISFDCMRIDLIYRQNL